MPEHPGGVLRAERLSMRNPRKSLATDRKEACNRVKVGNMHITGGVYQSYLRLQQWLLLYHATGSQVVPDLA